jgi:hypothetical protein
VILGEQCQCTRAARIRIEHLDRTAPRRSLRGVDLAKIQHMPLHHPAIVETFVLDNVPVAVRLAVFLASRLPKKHDDANLCTRNLPGNRVGLHYSRFRQNPPFSIKLNQTFRRSQKS